MDFLTDLESCIPSLRRYARALLHHPDDADDLVQDCLERAIGRRHLWCGGATVRPWLFRIMHNLYVNQLRHRRRQPGQEPLPGAWEEPAAEGAQTARVTLREMESALAGLREEQRQVVVMVAVTGMSYQEQIVGNQAIFIFALSILLVYLVLAALYESWTNPFAVIMAVPLALLGVVGGMIARGFANDMYCQIGIVLMIAMAAKNAILVVEFARGEREKGVPLAQAAINAAHERFRPIMMTSLAFILGMLPLASAQGAGAAGQQVLGTAVLGGMITATLFNNLFVPPFYVILQGLSEWLGGGRNARNEASSPAASPPAMPPPAMPTEQA